MDLALVKFVGAGLTTLAPSLGVNVPTGAVGAGDKLVAYLLETHPTAMRSIIEGVVRDIWVDWRRSGLPMSDAALHLESLPQIMDEHRPPADLMLGAYAVAKSGMKLGRAGVVVPARKVASSFILKAREARVFADETLNDSIAFFLLERLYIQLLLSRSWIDQLVPAFDDYFYKSLWRSDQAEPEPTVVVPTPAPQPVAPVASFVAPRPRPVVLTPTPPQTSAVALRKSLSSVHRDEPKAKVAAPPHQVEPAKLQTLAKAEPRIETMAPAALVATKVDPDRAELLAAIQSLEIAEKPAAPAAAPPKVEPQVKSAPVQRDGLVTNLARALSWIPRPTRGERDTVVPAAAAPAAKSELPPAEVAFPPEPVTATPPLETVTAQVPVAPAPSEPIVLAPVHQIVSVEPVVLPDPQPMTQDVPQPKIEPRTEPNLETVAVVSALVVPSTEIAASAAHPILASYRYMLEPPPSPRALLEPAVAAQFGDTKNEPISAGPAYDRTAEIEAAPVEQTEPDPQFVDSVPIIDTAPAPRFEISDLDIEIEELTKLPVTACAALRGELTARLGVDAIDRSVLIRHVDKLIAVVQGMRPVAGLMSRTIQLRESAMDELLTGNIAECEEHLLEAEEVELAAAEAEPSAARLHRGFATDIRVAIAEIEEACGDYRRAAGHIGAAERNLAPTDRHGRWQMLLRQARTLLNTPDGTHDGAIVTDAIEAYQRALAVAGQRDAPSEWAGVQRSVATLLIAKSTIEGNDAPLQEALTHLSHALEAFSRSRASDEWAETLVQRGMVLSLIAGASKDRLQLVAAAEAFRAALGPLSLERTPKSWAAARAHLGLVLKQLAEIDKIDAYLLEAVTNFHAVLDAEVDLSSANGLTMVDLASEFGEATLALAASRDEPGALTMGAAALCSLAPRLKHREDRLRVAEILNQLGGGIWRIGGKRQDADVLGKAAKVKQSAIAEFEAIGETDRVRMLNGELERLHDFILTVVEQTRLRPRDVARTG